MSVSFVSLLSSSSSLMSSLCALLLRRRVAFLTAAPRLSCMLTATRSAVSLSATPPPPVLRPTPAERRAQRTELRAREDIEEAAYFHERTLVQGTDKELKKERERE